MNTTLRHADSLTHLKIVATALIASVLIAGISIASRMRAEERTFISFEARYVLFDKGTHAHF